MADEKPPAAVAQARGELENADRLGNEEAVKAAKKRLAAAGVSDEDDGKRKAPEGRSTRAKATTAKSEE